LNPVKNNTVLVYPVMLPKLNIILAYFIKHVSQLYTYNVDRSFPHKMASEIRHMKTVKLIGTFVGMCLHFKLYTFAG